MVACKLAASILVVLVLGIAFGVPGLSAQEQAADCQPSWVPTFGQQIDASVRALAVFDDGGGSALYAGFDFGSAGGVAASFIGKWDGTGWSPLGTGMNAPVFALGLFDDGSGPALIAGGMFSSAGGVMARGIAKWDGNDWSALSGGPDSNVYALATFDDGGGPALYVGGFFIVGLGGGVLANNIAKWDGVSWSALGSGMNSAVDALTVFDDGNGPALYAGGDFNVAGGSAANHIARWDGTNWSALAGDMDNRVNALTVLDIGSGAKLHAGGWFTTAGGVAANGIATWDGTGWTALGSGMGGVIPVVFALIGFDDGSGSALYAGGLFTTAGGIAANGVARWDGTSWSALGSGVTGGSFPGIDALSVFDAGSGPALFAGGNFTSAPDSGDSFLAKWGGCSATVSPWTNLGSSLPGVSGAPLLEGSGTMEAGSQNVLDLSNAAPSAVAILFAAPSSLPTPFKGGIVLPDPIYPPTFGMTDAAGTIKFRFIQAAGMPSGSQAWIQWGITDAAAVKGVSLSNAVEGVTP